TVDGDGNTTVAGTMDIEGDTTVGDYFTITAADGSMSAADGNFTVDGDGNTTVAGTMDIEGDTTVGDYFTITAADGSMSAADGKFKVDGNGAISAANGEFKVDKDGNTKIKGALGAGANGTEFAVGSQGNISAASGKFTVDKDGNTAIYGDTQLGGDFAVTDKFTVDGDTGDTNVGGKLSVAGDTTIYGNTQLGGDLAVTDKFTVEGATGNTAVGGTFSAAAGKFTVDGNGNTAIYGDTQLGGDFAVTDKFTVDGDTGDTNVGGKLSVAGDTAIYGNTQLGGDFAVTDKFTVDSATGDTIAAGKMTAKEFANGSATFSVDETGNIKGTSLAFNGDADGVKVNSIDQGTAIVDGDATTQARKETMATLATVAATVGDLAGLADDANGVTSAQNVADAIDSLSQNVKAATGVTYDATTGAATTVYTKATAVDYDGLTTGISLREAIEQLDGNIGTAVTVFNNEVLATNSVNANIDAINTRIGDVASLQNVNKNLSNGGDTNPATVVEALDNIDATLGVIHGLAEKLGNDYKGNLQTGNAATVEAHLTSLDAAIGDRQLYNNTAASNGYTASAGSDVVTALTEIASNIGTAGDLGEAINNVVATNTVNQNIASLNTVIGDVSKLSETHYASQATNLTDAVRSLDTGLYDLDHEVRRLRHHFEGGMASAAALSALQPNARATGNTQLAIGTGAYKGHGAMAIGGFHWFTDNLLFNAGVAYDNREATYRMGVTYSW
ncbi:MAG: YadA-like family protein, partial [Alphaproteobacteria bacterium]|nr:YadA-like family protein [Alphaproteobacteria bacterium]